MVIGWKISKGVKKINALSIEIITKKSQTHNNL
jgi:hypothetical protein